MSRDVVLLPFVPVTATVLALAFSRNHRFMPDVKRTPFARAASISGR